MRLRRKLSAIGPQLSAASFDAARAVMIVAARKDFDI
jgi:hypothetical protein